MGGGGCAGLTHRLLPAAGGHGSLRHLTPSEYARKGRWRRGLLGEIAQGAGPQISRFPLLRPHAGDRFGARSVEMLRTPLRFLGSGRGSVGDQAAWRLADRTRARTLLFFRAARACQRSKAVCCASHTSAAPPRSRPSQRSMRSAIAGLIAARPFSTFKRVVRSTPS